MVAVRLVPSSSTRCGALAWRSQGKPFATIVAKVTLTYGPDGACRLDEPRAIVSRDQHLERNPTKSLEEATDLIPYLGKAELHLRGAAVCPSGSQVVPRVTITRDGGAILERAFVARPPAGARSVELVAENALGGPGHPVNPVGTPTPSLLNANDPSQPLLVGPIPRMWSARATLLTPEQRKATQQREVALDAAFDWEFFQAAAREQRAATFFRGDESLALAHLDAEQPQLEVRLPGARVEAAWVKGPDERVPLVMRCDTLRLDSKARTITLSWRGFFEVTDADSKMVIAVTLSMPGRPVEWPEISDEPEPSARPSEPSAPAIPSLDATGVLHLDGLNAPTMPFATPVAATPSSRPMSSAPIPGAPFSDAEPGSRPTIELGSTVAARAGAPHEATPFTAPRAAPPPAPFHAPQPAPAPPPPARPAMAPLPAAAAAAAQPARSEPIALKPAAAVDTSALTLAPGRGSKLLLAVVAAVKAR